MYLPLSLEPVTAGWGVFITEINLETIDTLVDSDLQVLYSLDHLCD